MLCDVVRRRRRRRWAHAPVIHAACHFDHKKRVAWVPISMHTCGSFFYNYGAPLGGPSGRRSSAITLVDDSTVEIVAVVEVSDQEHEYDMTQAAIWMMTITTPTPTQQHSPGLVAPFALIFALTCGVCTIGRAPIHYLKSMTL